MQWGNANRAISADYLWKRRQGIVAGFASFDRQAGTISLAPGTDFRGIHFLNNPVNHWHKNIVSQMVLAILERRVEIPNLRRVAGISDWRERLAMLPLRMKSEIWPQTQTRSSCPTSKLAPDEKEHLRHTTLLPPLED
jgi:hypothetical protein